METALEAPRTPPVQPPRDGTAGPDGGEQPVTLRPIVVFELRLLRAERLAVMAGLFLAALLAYAVVGGVQRDRAARAATAEVLDADTTRLNEAVRGIGAIFRGEQEPPPPFRDPRHAYSFGMNTGRQHAVLPPAPLGILAVGQTDVLPRHVPITLRTLDVTQAGEELEHPLHAMTGEIDAVFVIVFILPLLVLALTYGMLTHERETGTLRLLLSQPVSVRRLLAGKVVARAALVMGIAVAAVAAGVLWNGVSGAGFAGARAVLFTAVVVGYLAFWFALGVVVNLLGRSSAGNAVAMAAAWLLLVVLAPTLVSAVASIAYPIPSRAELINAQREAARVAQARGSELLAAYYQDHPELAPEDVDVTLFAPRALAVLRASEETTAPLSQAYRAQREGQVALVERLRVLSPALVAHLALTDAAGSGESRFRHFATQAEVFHASFRSFLEPPIYRNDPLTPGHVESMPRWTYREESSRAVARRLATEIVWLTAFSGALVLLGFAALRRFRPV